MLQSEPVTELATWLTRTLACPSIAGRHVYGSVGECSYRSATSRRLGENRMDWEGFQEEGQVPGQSKENQASAGHHWWAKRPGETSHYFWHDHDNESGVYLG